MDWIYFRENVIAKKVFLPVWDNGKSSMFCQFRKLENLKIFIVNKMKGYNETSQYSNLVHLKFERLIEIGCLLSHAMIFQLYCDGTYMYRQIEEEVEHTVGLPTP